jgi:hypothetical protein
MSHWSGIFMGLVVVAGVSGLVTGGCGADAIGIGASGRVIVTRFGTSGVALGVGLMGGLLVACGVTSTEALSAGAEFAGELLGAAMGSAESGASEAAFGDTALVTAVTT